MSFNPRSHVGSDFTLEWSFCTIESFNPRSHVGSDPVGVWYSTQKDVSIHAPTWGATRLVKIPSSGTKVSIHAPTWGATAVAVADYLDQLMFQSTLPRGERLTAARIVSIFSEFQSTLPRGERQNEVLHTPETTGFNPRSHVGSDWWLVAVHKDELVSIHAPTWGATKTKNKKTRKVEFQSTLPRGERHLYHLCAYARARFQSTLPRGERLVYGKIETDFITFQSTLPRGERPQL